MTHSGWYEGPWSLAQKVPYVQEVVEKTQVSGDYFNTFLHQNYLEFLSTVEDVERFLEYLSDADTLSSQYTVRCNL